MAALTDTDHTKTTTEYAETFVEAYYNALNSARTTIGSFYVPTSGMNTERGLPLISMNGEVIHDAAELQSEYETNAFTFFEPTSIDAHVLNPNFGGETDEKTKRKDAEQNISMVISVSGNVRIEERLAGPQKGFSDSFVLVPNTPAAGAGGKSKQGEGRKWLIQTQHFRFVVDQD